MELELQRLEAQDVRQRAATQVKEVRSRCAADLPQLDSLVAIQPFGSYVIAGCEEGPILVYDTR